MKSQFTKNEIEIKYEIGSAILTSSLQTIDFGVLQLNKSTTKKLYIKNEGSAETSVSITSSNPSIPYIIRPIKFDLESGKTQAIHILFHPLKVYNFDDSLIIKHSVKSDSLNIQIKGSCQTAELHKEYIIIIFYYFL